jgi:hypothetical protein
MQCKWKNTNYTLTNGKLSQFVLGTHVYKGSDIRSDHIFLISKDKSAAVKHNTKCERKKLPK